MQAAARLVLGAGVVVAYALCSYLNLPGVGLLFPAAVAAFFLRGRLAVLTASPGAVAAVAAPLVLTGGAPAIMVFFFFYSSVVRGPTARP